jgi:iron(III) transport system substrate-binding protein
MAKSVGSRLGDKAKYRGVVAVGVFVAALALSGCSNSSGGSASVVTGPPVVADQAKWDDIVKAAKTEGEVVVYEPPIAFGDVFEEFKKAYPEINVKLEEIPTADLIGRLDQQISMNATGADVTVTSSSAWLEENFAANNFAALQVSPQTGGEGWASRLADKSFATVWGYPFTIGHSTKIASDFASEEELLEAQPGAKVALNSPQAAPAVAFYYETLRQTYGDQILDRLAKTNHVTAANGLSMAQGLGAGDYDYAFPAVPAQLNSLIEKGAPVDQVVPKEGATGAYYSVAVLRSAAHPNAAQVLANWLMSREGATQMVSKHPPATVQLDVPGAIPWGTITAYDPADWTREKWDAWIAKEWTPRFG